MPKIPIPADEQEFYAYWGRVITVSPRISDSQLASLLEHTTWPDARDIVLVQLTVRMILSPSQTQAAIAWAKSQSRRNYALERELKALAILQDGLKGPLYKLQATLDLEADWASALAIQEVLPWYTNHARQMIIASNRPNAVKNHLIKVINAHSDEIRLNDGFAN